jgi:hypothetical protein
MKRLSLFVFTPTYAYSFGCVIVAAHDLPEAETVKNSSHMASRIAFDHSLEKTYATGKPRIVLDNAGEE